jgi:hypothetical protein
VRPPSRIPSGGIVAAHSLATNWTHHPRHLCNSRHRVGLPSRDRQCQQSSRGTVLTIGCGGLGSPRAAAGFCIELMFHRATCVEFVEGTADRLASEASHGHATPTTAWRPASMQPEGLCSSAVLRAIFLPCRGRTVASQFRQALGRWGNVSSFPSPHRFASTSQLIAFRSCCSNSLARTRARPLHHLQSSAEQHPHSHRPSGTATGARRWHGAAGMMRPT